MIWETLFHSGGGNKVFYFSDTVLYFRSHPLYNTDMTGNRKKRENFGEAVEIEP